MDWHPAAKLVLPGTGCAWLLSEIVHSNYQLYGYGISDYGRGDIQEGFIDISLLELMSDPLQMHHVQQDSKFVPLYCMSVYQIAARMNGGIVDDKEALQEAFDYLNNASAVQGNQTRKAPQLQP